ncbi:tRNA (adenosine(37)-N6)-threonylcarbamoyltransferase complex dimerization subunit type 1 TsaB [Candidatus Latescibacterota bacterium]
MIILGIETATESLSTALSVNDKMYERSKESRTSHCELLAGFISELTDEAGITPKEINCVSVSTGPGSFTGLRIGIATAMGLAYGLNINACGISTLMGLAYGAGKSADPGTFVCPVIDAKRSETYTALYKTTDDVPQTIVEPLALPVSRLADMLGKRDEKILITGPAADKFKDILTESLGDSIEFVSPELANPSAKTIAELGLRIFRSTGGANPALLEPVYLRRSDAEILRDSKKNNSDSCSDNRD